MSGPCCRGEVCPRTPALLTVLETHLYHTFLLVLSVSARVASTCANNFLFDLILNTLQVYVNMFYVLKILTFET